MTTALPPLAKGDLAGLDVVSRIQWLPTSRPPLDVGRAAQLGEVMACNPHLHKLEIYESLDDGAAYELAKTIRAHPTLDEVYLKSQQALSQDALQALTDASLSLPQLKTLQVKASGVEAPLIKHICETAAQHQELTSICLSKNPLSPESVGDIRHLFANKHNWQRIRLMDCELDHPDIRQIAESLGNQPDLCRFHLQGNITDGLTYDDIGSALLASGSHNLISAIPASNEATLRTNDNRKIAGDVLSMVQLAMHSEKAPSVLTTSELVKRLPSIALLNLHTDKLQNCENYLAELPQAETPLSTDALLKPANYMNQCPAENPRTWQEPETVIAALIENGEKLDEKWMSRKTPHQETLAACALTFNPHGFIDALNNNGIQIRGTHLLDDKNKPNDLLQALIDTDNCEALFSMANWQGSSLAELQATVSTLPDSIRQNIPNLQQLRYTLGQAERVNGVGR